MGQLLDISSTGAKLHIFGRIDPRAKAEEFFPMMTTNGNVRKRAKMAWQRQHAIGVAFIAANT